MIPTRFVIATMMFMACFISYTMRVNISINLIAMVEPTKIGGHNAVPECTLIEKNLTNLVDSNGTVIGTAQGLDFSPNYGRRYDWDTKLQSLILGSFFWGFTLTCIPGGAFAEKFGPTKTVTISTLIAGGLTILAPVMASWSVYALIASRFLTGLCGGVIYPSLHCLVSRWAPPAEKGKFIGALLGGNLGTVVTWPVLGAVIEKWGWSWSWFLNGAVILIWTVTWILLVSDSPRTHPRISEEERQHIESSLGQNVSEKKGLAPYGQIFRSVPFYALAILHYGNLWGLFFLVTASPSFMSSVLGFNVGHTGVLAALPHLARLLLGFGFGFIGDFIRKRELLSTTTVRKGFVVFSHIIPGLFLLVLNTTGCDFAWTVALMTLSLGSNGASTLTNLQNSQDLSPNFAGTLYGIINCIGSTTGFVTPLIVGYLTADHNGLREWHTIFIIGALVYIVCGLVFCVFGSAELQSWNDPGDSSLRKSEDNMEDKNMEKSKGIENPAFDNISEATVKVADVIENTKV